MKNYVRYMAGIASLLVVFACDPYEDIYDELDAKGEEFAYTLVDADYTTIGKADGGADIGKNKYFTSEDQFKQFAPYALRAKYPKANTGTKVQVTYKMYAPIRVDSNRAYTMTEADYNAITEPTLQLSGSADVYKAATYVWPNVNNFDVLALRYAATLTLTPTNTTKDSTSRVLRYNDAWSLPYVVTRADYRHMGQSFDNFDNRATAITRIEIMFNERFPYANATGEVRFAIYAYTYTVETKRFTINEIVQLTFNGTRWVAKQDVTPATLQFEYDGANWIPDNTIPYKLAAADYKAIAENKGLGTPDADNANSFGNFDRRSSSGNYWDDAEIEAGLDFLLKKLYPSAAEGQKYAVSFAVYTGSAGTETFVMIKEGDKYIRFVKK